jgi:hypothetical protein
MAARLCLDVPAPPELLPSCCCWVCYAVSCNGSATISNGAFSCPDTPTGQMCAGACNSGYAGQPTATCWNGNFAVTGSCLLSGGYRAGGVLRCCRHQSMPMNAIEWHKGLQSQQY